MMTSIWKDTGKRAAPLVMVMLISLTTISIYVAVEFQNKASSMAKELAKHVSRREEAESSLKTTKQNLVEARGKYLSAIQKLDESEKVISRFDQKETDLAHCQDLLKGRNLMREALNESREEKLHLVKELEELHKQLAEPQKKSEKKTTKTASIEEEEPETFRKAAEENLTKQNIKK